MGRGWTVPFPSPNSQLLIPFALVEFSEFHCRTYQLFQKKSVPSSRRAMEILSGRGWFKGGQFRRSRGGFSNALFPACQVIKTLTAPLLSKLTVNGRFKIRTSGYLAVALLYYCNNFIITFTIWYGTHNKVESKRT